MHNDVTVRYPMAPFDKGTSNQERDMGTEHYLFSIGQRKKQRASPLINGVGSSTKSREGAPSAVARSADLQSERAMHNAMDVEFSDLFQGLALRPEVLTTGMLSPVASGSNIFYDLNRQVVSASYPSHYTRSEHDDFHHRSSIVSSFSSVCPDQVRPPVYQDIFGPLKVTDIIPTML